MSQNVEWIEVHDREDFEREARNDPYTQLWRFECDPREVLDFEVVDADAEMNWVESHIGTNLGSVVDYGRHWDLSDEELIDKVADKLADRTPQFLGFMDDDKETVTDTVLIVRKDSGYVKVPKLD